MLCHPRPFLLQGQARRLAERLIVLTQHLQPDLGGLQSRCISGGLCGDDAVLLHPLGTFQLALLLGGFIAGVVLALVCNALGVLLLVGPQLLLGVLGLSMDSMTYANSVFRHSRYS